MALMAPAGLTDLAEPLCPLAILLSIGASGLMEPERNNAFTPARMARHHARPHETLRGRVAGL